MATISVDQYNDDNTTSRAAGEALTINGATFTQRTDTRWHAYSPASMTGTYSDILPSATLGGRFVIDASNVRWLAYNSGSGNVPAIGTSITQAGVSSSYLLGVYASMTDAPTAVGNAMPGSGFLKFREVSGAFTSGALTGIGASATAADVTGWLEIVMDQGTGVDINIPRLGEFESRGGWFYLDNTDGTTAQVLQVPTNGGGANTYSPGVWIEKASPTAATYDLVSNTITVTLAAHGYYVGDDVDVSFSSGGMSGQETYHIISVPTADTFTVAQTGANTSGNCSVSQFEFYPGLLATTGWLQRHIGSPGLDGANDDLRQKFVKTIGTGQMQLGENASQSATYTTASLSATYTWSANTVTVTSTAHGLRVGEQVYLDFTSGAATPDGVYTILTNAANTFTVSLSGSGASGNVTVWARSIVTFASHGYAIGNQVYLNWTSGGVTTDGVYIIETVATDTFTVNTYTNSATGGNVTIEMTIGYIPASGLRTRVPNIFLRQCATGTRASNAAPHATITTRPEFITSSAGAIDAEYLYGDWYFNFLQPYSVHINHLATFDSILLQECATEIDINDVGLGMHGNLDLNALNCQSNFAGGTISNCHMVRGNAPGSSDHDIIITACKDLELINVVCGILQYARSTGYSMVITNCNNVTLTRLTSINSTTISLVTSKDITFNSLNWVDRYMGMTNATAASYCVTIGAGIVNTIIDGIGFGYNGEVANVHPYAGLVSFTATVNTIIRNVGTRVAMVSGGTIPLWRMGILFLSGGNNDTIKIQRVYVETLTTRTGILTESNTDNNIILESVFCYQYTTVAGVVTSYTVTPLFLNSSHKGIGAALNSVTPQVSVYGTHWMDLFTSDTTGRILAIMNEPTEDTAAYSTLTIGGLGGFTSAGTLSLQSVDDEYLIECPYWILGHTSLNNATATVTGTNVTYVSGPDYGNHDIYYQIDTGSGWNGSWKDLTGANLSSETISATGFRLKFRIVCDTASATNVVSFIRIDTTSTVEAQSDNLYTLDTATISLTNLIPGSRYEIYNTTTSTSITNAIATSSSASVVASASNDDVLRIRVRKSINSPQSSTYTWAGNVVEVTYSGHGRYVGEPIELEFDTGDAVGQDGSFTIVSVPTSSTYTVSLAGSGAGGNVDATPVKYLPIETGAVIENLAASTYISQIEDIIA
jgi:hypothetical protein